MKKHFFLLLLAFCLLLYTAPTKALTNEEILERISNLEQEAASLRALLALPEKEKDRKSVV